RVHLTSRSTAAGTRGGGRLCLPDHVLQQVYAAVAVAPLVVVPRDELEEVLVQLDAAAGVEDAAVRVVDEVGRDDLVLGVGQDVLQVGLARPLHRVADFLVAGGLRGLHRQVHDRDGGRRHPEG